MAKSKDDIKYATAQAKVSEDDGLRARNNVGTPLEAGEIADSHPVDLFYGATRISSSSSTVDQQPPGPAATVAESQPVHVFSGADHQPQGPYPNGSSGGA